VNDRSELGFTDWDWLLSQPYEISMQFTRLLRFENEIIIKMNGHKNEGIILKPDGTE
jgi:hypothetical protein